MTTIDTGIVRLSTVEWLKLLGGCCTVLGIFYSMHYQAVSQIQVHSSRLDRLEVVCDKISDKIDDMAIGQRHLER